VRGGEELDYEHTDSHGSMAFVKPTVLSRHPRSAQLEPGAYLTDDTHLYYVVLVSASAESWPLVTLEDRGTLEPFVCPVHELEGCRLRVARESNEAEALEARAPNRSEKEEKR
jgi:hypothetical protein